MPKLVNCLVQQQLLDERSAQAALAAAMQQKMALTTYLVKHKLIDSRDLLFYLAQYFALPTFDLKHYVYENAHKILSHDLINRYRALPVKVDPHTITLCVSDPTQDNAFSAISFHTSKQVNLMLGDEALLEKILASHCRPNMLLAKFFAEDEATYLTEPSEKDDEPIIEYVNHLISNAIEKQVSDIHIEPYSQHCRIRFRRDGLLCEAASLPLHAAVRVITRLKIMANLNIAERRLPQDGRIAWRQEKNIDIRLNCIPTLHGEKIVLRLLDANAVQLNLDALGLYTNQLQQLRNSINKPQGLILVTGPTGSGKSVTLYSMLRELNQTTKNISSVEDPIEIDMHGINQINVNQQIGLTFPAVLRMLLRQDPDILMIGEIRDLETATIAIQAAQTGHLVLSTLHTNSAAETIKRLLSMGIKDYQLADSLSLIIAQRLVRTLCHHCKQRDNDDTYRPTGCEQCHHGYRGRTGVFALSENLWDVAQQKVRDGVTTLSEIQRVIMDSKTNENI